MCDTCTWAPKVFVMANTRFFRVVPIDHEKMKEFLDIAPEKVVILSGWPPTVMLDRWVGTVISAISVMMTLNANLTLNKKKHDTNCEH